MKVKTSGSKKIIHQFNKFLRSKKYVTFVAETREKFGIPEHGFEFEKPKQAIEEFKKKSTYGGSLEDNLSTNLHTEIQRILEEFDLNTRYLSTLIKHHILFNEFFYDEFESLQEKEDTCYLSEVEYELDNFSTPYDQEIAGSFAFEDHNTGIYQELMRYPISLRIHPGASKGDIKDFIDKNWEDIESLQKKYASQNSVTLRNSKTSSNPLIQERDDFIWEHKDTPSAQIVSILFKKFGSKGIYDMDEGAIRKILSNQRKLRE